MKVKKIWFIANKDQHVPYRPGSLLIKGLRENGIEVVHTEPNDYYGILKVDRKYYNYHYVYRNPLHLSPPKGFDPDVIIVDHVPPVNLYIDSDKPIGHYYREQYHPPTCVNPDFILWSNPESMDYLVWQYPQVLTNTDTLNMFLPICGDPDIFPVVPFEDKIDKIFFMGANTSSIAGWESWIFKTVYEKRTKILKNLKDNNVGVWKTYTTKIKDYLDENAKYLSSLIVFGRTPMGLRLFEAGACYSVPVIWCENEESKMFYENMGFIHNFNCYMFENMADLYYYNILDRETKYKMAQRAHDLIMERHTPKVRAKELIDWLEKNCDTIGKYVFGDFLKDLEHVNMNGSKQFSSIHPHLYNALDPTFIKFRDEITGTQHTEEEIKHLYCDSPNGSARCFVKSLGDKIIAEYSMLPQKYLINGEEKDASLCFDVATKKQYQGKGIFTEMGKYVTEYEKGHDVTFSIGFPNTKAIKGHMNNNWIVFGDRPIFESTSIVGNPIIVEWCEHIHDDANILISRPSGSDMISLMKINQSSYKVIQKRDKEWLGWRWKDTDLYQYQPFTIMKKGTTICYGVVKNYLGEKAHIVDMLFADNDEYTFKIVLSLLHDYMCEKEIRYCSFMLPRFHPFSQFCVKSGIFTKVEEPGIIIVKPYRDDWKFTMNDFYITFADTDNY